MVLAIKVILILMCNERRQKEERGKGLLSAVTSGALAVVPANAVPRSTHDSEPAQPPVRQFSRRAARNLEGSWHTGFPVLCDEPALVADGPPGRFWCRKATGRAEKGCLDTLSGCACVHV